MTQGNLIYRAWCLKNPEQYTLQYIKYGKSQIRKIYSRAHRHLSYHE